MVKFLTDGFVLEFLCIKLIYASIQRPRKGMLQRTRKQNNKDAEISNVEDKAYMIKKVLVTREIQIHVNVLQFNRMEV